MQQMKFELFMLQRLASELNMYEAQSSEYKYEIERLARELQEIKKKYFIQKKKEQQQRYVIKLFFIVVEISDW